jgi:hypothetical protein
VFCIWTKIAQNVFCDKDRPGLVLHWPVKNWKQVNLQPQNRQASAILLLASTLLRSTAAVQTLRCQAALPPPCDATTVLLHYAAADNARCLRCAAASCPPLRCRQCTTTANALGCRAALRCPAKTTQRSAAALHLTRCRCQRHAAAANALLCRAALQPRCRCQHHAAAANALRCRAALPSCAACSSAPLTCEDTTAIQRCAAAANA